MDYGGFLKMGLPQVTMFQYYQWIGLRQKLPEPPCFMGKSMVSCRFSLQPIH